jgi:hypothetical protein
MSRQKKTIDLRRPAARELERGADAMVSTGASAQLDGAPCAANPKTSARPLPDPRRRARSVPRFGTYDGERGRQDWPSLGPGAFSNFGKASA